MKRVVGVDVTRGLAILGMFAAHVGAEGPDRWSGSGLLALADGRSSATFALLAGVSAALLSGGIRPAEGLARRRARVRILVRAALLLPIGAVLVLLGTPLAIILPGYALMFALLTVVLGWRRRTLLAAAVVVAVLGPVFVLGVRRRLELYDAPAPWDPVGLVAGEYYPAAVWMAYLLVGLAVGRTDLLARAAPWRLLALGAGLAVVGYVPATLLLSSDEPPRGRLGLLLYVAPHADTTPEVVGNIGVSLAVLGLALLAVRHARVVMTPLAATGALALTVYTVHVVVIALLGREVVYDARNEVLLAFVLVTLVLTTVWRAALGRGPLEWVLHRASTLAADAVVPRDPPTPEPECEETVESRTPA